MVEIYYQTVITKLNNYCSLRQIGATINCFVIHRREPFAELYYLAFYHTDTISLITNIIK